MFRRWRQWTVPSRRCSEQPRQTPLPSAPARAAPHRTASPRAAQRRSPSACPRPPLPHYIGEAAAAAQEAGTRRPARIPPPHTHGRTTDERRRREILPPLGEAAAGSKPPFFPARPPAVPLGGLRQLLLATAGPRSLLSPPSPEGRQPSGRGGSLTEKSTGQPQPPGERVKGALEPLSPSTPTPTAAAAPPTAARGASLRRRCAGAVGPRPSRERRCAEGAGAARGLRRARR